MSSRHLVWLVGSLCLALLVGCSDDDGEGAQGLERSDPVPATQVLAAVRPTPPGPVTLDTTLEAQLAGEATGFLAAFVDTPLSVEVGGPADTASAEADLTVAVDAGAIRTEGRYVATGGRSFVQVLEQWYSAGEAAGGTLPGDVLGVLGRADAIVGADARVVGTESVEGVLCDVVEGDARPEAVAAAVAAVANALPIGPTADLTAESLAGAVEPTTARLWIGRDDHQLHRVRLDGAVDPAATGLGAAGVTRAEVVLDASVVARDEQVEVDPPASARPLEELGGALGGLAPFGNPDGAEG